MNHVSACSSDSIAEATLRKLLSLALQSAANECGAPAASIRQSLQELLEIDVGLRQWLAACSLPATGEKKHSASCRTSSSLAGNPNKPPGDAPSHTSSAAERETLERVASQLPEFFLQNWEILPGRSTELGVLLQQALHIAVRCRSFHNNNKDELERGKRDTAYHLAYGLSHELNNPLANISTRAGILLTQGGHPPTQREMLQTIVENAMRGSEMLADLMLVARPPELDFQQVNAAGFLDEFIQDATAWAERWGLKLVSSYHLQVTIHADRAALREAIWALIRNAIEASAAISEAVHLKASVDDNEPTWFRMEILDHGPGLSPQALQHCFDPYYSGREAGRGLGVGLTKALRIIELHGGRLSLKNRSSGGCAALVKIPVSSQNSHFHPKHHSAADSKQNTPRS